ncbi:MAG: acetyl-CoA carboxylase biotin carboxylase subunit [Rhodothermales bacterium]
MQKVLIANRGEIALRVIRTCHELGLKTVAVFSTADRDSLPVRFADEAVCIGPPAAKDSYLRIDRMIAAAEVTGADAIHPGYGFLAENADFSAVCKDHGLEFIGPTPETIRLMGDKNQAKRTMIAAGVPTVPGSDGIVEDEKAALKAAAAIGYPVMIKASAGGGGKGMRIAANEAQLPRQFSVARNEAESAFGSSEVYIEKLVASPRHVEIQVMGDGKGNVIHLAERECSIQRRHQKLIEEAPSPAVDKQLRAAMGEAAVRAAEAVNYRSAGTVEFLLDKSGDFYFMEMNTRIQVEHPITEEITGTDLIEMQILIANGEKLRLVDPVLDGHSIECRVNAEDPYMGFRPSPGLIEAFHTPKGRGVRVETHAYAGYVIPPYYDSMIAKLVVHAKSRPLAIAKMKRALGEFIVEGVKTTIPLHEQIMTDERFVSGNFDTNFLEHFELRPVDSVS